MVSIDAAAFIHDVRFEDLPPSVVEQALRCLLDLTGVAAAGSRTEMSRIARDHAVENFGSPTRQVRLLFDSRSASPIGAALAGAATIDSFDAHDGHVLTKGHIGAAVLPALLAFADTAQPPEGRDFLTSLVLGYEIATRAGITLHATAPDYHTSGAWNALGCAAIGARLLRLTNEQTQHALGIAEYHGPRSQMMRCIDHPTMVKDGSALGAAAGVSAALLAAQGFTGAPAITTADAGTENVWGDLGERWRIQEQYFKPFPVCRWAHPAIQAALDHRLLGRVELKDIDHLEVATFHAATRLATRHPTTTEQAQYSLPFAVATAFVHGTITPTHIAHPKTRHPDVVRLSEGMILSQNDAYEARFPANRLSHLDLILRDGSRLHGEQTSAPGEPSDPLEDIALAAKHRALITGIVDQPHAQTLRQAIDALPEGGSIRVLLDSLLTAPVGVGPNTRH